MYLSMRGLVIRHISVAFINGAITLMILLIAPLGLAAVITNTVLIMASTLLSSAMVDGIVRFLTPGQVKILEEVQRQEAKLRQTEKVDEIEGR
ncbi:MULTISPECIES: CRISPR-associated protein Csx18 [Planktothricoides]|jgi:hypothetical protein|uniref:Uncharacterized protein n=1 Tax=Planktothricoides raciborskii FACHB-1370 TaxID=2949576 RepID=A0ABR8EJD7_9CYAN|nr:MULTISPECIES: CRISPR-associated protein Csx18 [Planktothricoides]KOR34717.1 hypothetical protein AM228_22395 [Planktothricoides sp. SR001]MBD2546685.1 hypothetical protein [Planktothricoides raciborskii FACHB-1370]MBD2582665.1 hypothetical protein [Planktothricoides raciborskii FACHB-1261]